VVFSPGTLVFSNNKTYLHDRTEILLKVALNIINHSSIFSPVYGFWQLFNLIKKNVTLFNLIKKNVTINHSMYIVLFSILDLTTVERRLQNKHYVKLIEFIKDVTKIFDNCRLYNTAETPFYQCAEVLDTFFVQRLKSLKDRIGCK
jgi:hypothetical protein